MASQDIANKVLHGKDGDVWVNGALLANLSKIDVKVKADTEDVNFCGDSKNYTIFNGYSLEGTLACKKIDSTLLKIVADAFKSGVMPSIKIVTSLTDKATGKAERTVIEGIVFTEFILASFEAKKMIDEEYPFKASSFDLLETI